jgi:hypothetical protein
VTIKPAPKRKAGPGKKLGNPNWVKGMASPYPAGRPPLGKSRAEQIEKVLNLTPKEVVDKLGGRSELARMFRQMPQDMTLLDLITIRAVSAIMFEPQAAMVNFVFDSLYGKVQTTLDVTSAQEKLGPSVVIFQDAPEDSEPAALAPEPIDGADGNETL